MTEQEFSLLKDLVHREFGLMIRGDKRLTFHAKVSHRLNLLGLRTYSEYYDHIVSDPTGKELLVFVSHITNNETYFFREKAQLNIFSEILKDIKSGKQKRDDNRIRIASLASSSGEEAYSLNICLQESGLFLWDWDVQIIGMDINTNALLKAQAASYSKNSFRMPDTDQGLTDKYFTITDGRYLLRRALTKNVEFRHGNIIDPDAYAGLTDLDVVFCRNVLIYMSDEALDKIVRNIYDSISDTGYLFIGSSESLIQRTDLFVSEHIGGAIVYRKKLRHVPGKPGEAGRLEKNSGITL